jgi:nucleoside-diphosphate-sugar epimerase
MESIVVVGGSGILGQYVVKDLHESGYKVSVFDVKKPEKKNSDIFRDIDFYEGSMANFDDCRKALKNADIVIHLAAIIAAITDFQPETIFNINTSGTFNIFQASCDLGISKVIYASSASVYGYNFRIKPDDRFIPRYLPIDEEHPLNPLDTYGVTKMIGEEIAGLFNKKYGITSFSLRLTHIKIPVEYDPDKIEESGLNEIEIYRSINSYRKNLVETGFMLWPLEPRLLGKGRNQVWSNFILNYNDVRDAASAFRLAAKVRGLDGKNEVFCIGNLEDNATRFSTAELLKKYMLENIPLKKEIKGKEPLYSCEKARKILGYQSKYNWWELYGKELFNQ